MVISIGNFGVGKSVLTPVPDMAERKFWTLYVESGQATRRMTTSRFHVRTSRAPGIRVIGFVQEG